MAQLSDDCFAFGGQLMSVDQALDLIKTALAPVTTREQVAIDQADGRILWEDVQAPLP